VSEPELVAAARRVAAYYRSGDPQYDRSGEDFPAVVIAERLALADALLNPTTPAQRAAVAVLSGDTRPEVLAPILDELAERFAGGPKVEPWQRWTEELPTVPGWYWRRRLTPTLDKPQLVEVYRVLESTFFRFSGHSWPTSECVDQEFCGPVPMPAEPIE